MNQNDLRVIKTKKLLRKIMMELLAKKALNEITVAELCRLAGINRSTFYSHYMNTDELFEEHFKLLIDELRMEYNPVLEGLEDPERQNMAPLFDHILKHRDFYDILLSDNAPIKYLMQFNRYLVEFPYEVIRRNVSEDIDIELYLAFCSSATMGMIYHWKNTGYVKTSEEMSYQIIKFFAKN